MKLTLTSPLLKALVRGFSKLLPARPHIPALGFVLFRHAPDTGLTATGTNLDEALTIRLPASVITDAGDTDPMPVSFSELKRLAQLLHKGDTTTLEPLPDNAGIRSTVTLGGNPVSTDTGTIPVAEFPVIPDVPATQPADIATFLAAYRRVRPAASRDPNRATLNSVFLDHEAHLLVATDGRRLMTVPLPAEFAPGRDLLIPPTKLLVNGLPEASAGRFAVEQKRDVTWLVLATAAWTYRVRCLDLQYPNYRQVIPPASTRWAGKIRLHPDDLSALRDTLKALLGTGEAGESVALYADRERVAVFGTADQPPDSKRPCLVLPESKAKTTEPMLCVLGTQFLLDGLEAGCTDVQYLDSTSPLRCEAPDGAVYVLMPWREVPAGVTTFVQETFNPAVGTLPSAKPVEEESMQKTTPAPTEPAGDAGPATTPPAESAPATAAASPARSSGLTMVPPEPAPAEELLTALTEAQEAAASLQQHLRELKHKVRAVERYYRTRAKEIEVKTQLIEKFQKAVSLTSAA
jgi:DNA polymerase III sliding clamp (beta) subunit (PCNA family)